MCWTLDWEQRWALCSSVGQPLLRWVCAAATAAAAAGDMAVAEAATVVAAADDEVTTAGASVAAFVVTVVVGPVCDVDSAPGNHTNTKWLHCICYY